MPGLLYRGELGVLCCIRRRFQTNVSEDAVATIDLRFAKLLTIDWNDPFALLAGGLSQQLLQPCSQIGNARRRNNRDLVAPISGGYAEDYPKHYSRILLDGHARHASLHHLLSAIEKLLRFQTHDCGWHHAEIG